MNAIYEYIAESLQAPDTALKQYDRIADGIESLNGFPKRCKLFESQPERDLGFKRLNPYQKIGYQRSCLIPPLLHPIRLA